MYKHERLSQMSQFISTFPYWSLKNLGYPMKAGTKVLCGPDFLAYMAGNKG